MKFYDFKKLSSQAKLIAFIFPILFFCLAFSSSAFGQFTCSLYPVDSSDLGSKTPLILIHGIHGKESGAAYWQKFVNYFYAEYSLTNKYKLYKFEYDSDEITLENIAISLSYYIRQNSDFFYTDMEGDLKAKEIVIVAHSMGGLVARAYIQNHNNDGFERVVRLITLATPHHGSPGANDEDALEPYYTSGLWDQIFSVSQFVYNLSGSTWNVTMHSTQPNRSDLRWDNYTSPYLDSDVNDWLQTLNSTLTPEIAQRIIAYYGYINPYRADRIYWEYPDQILLFLPSIYSYNDHTKLTIASAIMDAGLSELFPFNDGMVPVGSASFGDRASIVRREFFDHDHLDMKDGKQFDFELPLFNTLEDDLLNLVPGINHTPARIYAPGDAVFSARGPFPDGTTFDFIIDGPHVEKLDGNTFRFRAYGSFNVSMTINYPSGLISRS